MTVQTRVRHRDVPHPTPGPKHRFDWETDPDLTRFAGLSADDKMRVIIRVLCGLVALEEIEAESARLSQAHDPLIVEPAPKRRRLLPFLGYLRPPAHAPVLVETNAHVSRPDIDPTASLGAPMPWTRVEA